MIRRSSGSLAKAARLPLAALSLVVLAGCSMFGSGPVKIQPAELQPVSGAVVARQVWSVKVGQINFPLEVSAAGNNVAVASGDGTVALLDAQSGRDVWRATVKSPLSAGVGTDGKLVAVVTRRNEVVALQDGRELWRQQLGAQAYTAPFVAGARVFVLAADRSVRAFDGQTGLKLWTQQRPGEPLILSQSGVMLAVGDTLVVGLSGRLAGIDPANGNIRWEVPIATPRGINDVERLVDMVGRVSRQDDVVCARAFQASVGCVNAARGSMLWTKAANGQQGLDGDQQRVFGTEADGNVIAWKRADGERAWTTDRLRYRSLTAPVVVGRSIAVGDFAGYIHLLSREDGSLLNRLPTDGSAIAATPVLVGNTLVAVTRNGGVYGFQPQ